MKKNDSVLFEVLIWSTVFFVSFVYYVDHKSDQPRQKELNSKNELGTTAPYEPKLENPNALINKNLTEAHIQQMGEGSKTFVDNEYYHTDLEGSDIQDLKNLKKPKEDYQLKIEPENNTEKIVKSLNQNSINTTPQTPDETIRAELAYEKWLKKYDHEKTKIKLEKIKAAALEEGYLVVFDENNNLKSVTKIKKPKNQIK